MIIVYMSTETSDVKYKEVFMNDEKLITKTTIVESYNINNDDNGLTGIKENDEPVLLDTTNYERIVTKYKNFPDDLTEEQVTNEHEHNLPGKAGVAYFVTYKLKDNILSEGAKVGNLRRAIEFPSSSEEDRHIDPSFFENFIHDYEITSKKKDILMQQIKEMNTNFEVIYKYFTQEDPNTELTENTPPSIRMMQKLKIPKFEQKENNLWRINANIYKMFDRLVTLVPQIKKMMETQVQEDYNIQRWYNFVQNYGNSVLNITTDLLDNIDSNPKYVYYKSYIVDDFNIEQFSNYFFTKVKEIGITGKQKQELYCCDWFTRDQKSHFHTKAFLTFDGSNILLGDEYKVDGHNVYIAPDGKEYIKKDNNEVVQVYYNKKSKLRAQQSDIGNSGDLKFTLLQFGDNTTLSEFAQNIGYSNWEWVASSIPWVGSNVGIGKATSAYAKYQEATNASRKFGGKRITRRKRKQKRRSTRKRR